MSDEHSFTRKIQDLINENCMENVSDTPDYILAFYLNDCLNAFNNAVLSRREWHSTENTKDWETKI